MLIRHTFTLKVILLKSSTESKSQSYSYSSRRQADRLFLIGWPDGQSTNLRVA